MILLIGIDGYSWAWADALRERGFDTAPLLSPKPVSWLAWNTIGTGVEAQTWGITENPNSYVTFGRKGGRRPPYLWERVQAAGGRLVIANWPFVIQAGPTRGVLVCGYPAGREHFVYPASEQVWWNYHELDFSNEHELARAGPEVRKRLLAIEPAEHVGACARRRKWLMQRFVAGVERHNPTLAFLGIMDLDRLSHYAYSAMQDEEQRAAIIAGICDVIDEITGVFKPEATIIFSDHGLDCSVPPQADGRGEGHGTNLPASQRGVLALKQEGYSLPSEAAALIDVAPMVLRRFGIDHNLSGIDRSVSAEEKNHD